MLRSRVLPDGGDWMNGVCIRAAECLREERALQAQPQAPVHKRSRKHHHKRSRKHQFIAQRRKGITTKRKKQPAAGAVGRELLYVAL